MHCGNAHKVIRRAGDKGFKENLLIQQHAASLFQRQTQGKKEAYDAFVRQKTSSPSVRIFTILTNVTSPLKGIALIRHLAPSCERRR
jgi:hypothetical protein